MNDSETVVFEALSAAGRQVRKLHENAGHPGYPDFIVDDEFYVEVKPDKKNKRKLHNNQEMTFCTLTKPIFIYYVLGSNIRIERYVPTGEDLPTTKHIMMRLDDNDYERLQKARGNKSWKRFIMELAK